MPATKSPMDKQDVEKIIDEKEAEKKKGLVTEFAEFATEGRVLDLTVGIMVGASLTSLVNSFVNNILLPPINLFTDRINFTDLYINLSRTHAETLADAEAKGLPIIKVGQFANDMIDFIVIAAVIFILVKKVLGYNKEKSKKKK